MPDPISHHERRRSTRLQLSPEQSFEARYRFIDSEGITSHPHRHAAIALNVSVGGALLRGTIPDSSWAPRLLDGQDFACFEVDLGLSEPIEGLAQLRWLKPSNEPAMYELGLEFLRLRPGHLPLLQRFVLSRSSASGRLHGFPEVL